MLFWRPKLCRPSGRAGLLTARPEDGSRRVIAFALPYPTDTTSHVVYRNAGGERRAY